MTTKELRAGLPDASCLHRPLRGKVDCCLSQKRTVVHSSIPSSRGDKIVLSGAAEVESSAKERRDLCFVVVVYVTCL